MWIRRDHERRYYRHKGEWTVILGKTQNSYFRFHLTTPRHRLNFALHHKGYRPWWQDAKRLDGGRC